MNIIYDGVYVNVQSIILFIRHFYNYNCGNSEETTLYYNFDNN